MLTSLLQAGIAIASGLVSTLSVTVLFKVITAGLVLMGAVGSSWIPGAFGLGCVLAFTSLLTYSVLRLLGASDAACADASGTIAPCYAEEAEPETAEPLLA